MKKILFFVVSMFLLFFVFTQNSNAGCAYDSYITWPNSCVIEQPLIDPVNTCNETGCTEHQNVPCRGIRIKYVCTNITAETCVDIDHDSIGSYGIEGYYLSGIEAWSSTADDDFNVEIVLGSDCSGNVLKTINFDQSAITGVYEPYDSIWVFNGNSSHVTLGINLPDGVPDNSGDDNVNIYIWLIR